MTQLYSLSASVGKAARIFDGLAPNAGTSVVAAIAASEYSPAVDDVVATRFFDTNRVDGTGFQYVCTSVTASVPLLADGATTRTELGTSGGLKYWGDPFFFWVELSAGGNVASFRNLAFDKAVKLTGHGQSNMTGFQPDDGPGYTTPPVDTGTSPLVWIWNKYTTAWEIWDQTSNPGQYGSTKTEGPYASVVNNDCPMFHLARKIAEKTGALVLTVMNTRGGTDLERWLPSVGASDQMWDDYTDQIAECGLDRISHAFWLHGENQDNDTRNNTYDYITEWEKWRTAMLARSEFDAGVPVTVGQLRDFWQTSGVRLGGYDGVNGEWLPFMNGSDPQMFVAPTKDLESDTATSPDGDVHFGREEIRLIGREYFWQTYCQDRAPAILQLTKPITTDTTFTVDEGGYFTDRINGTFVSLGAVLDMLNYRRINPNVTVTIQINAASGGAYYSGSGWADLVIEHPDFAKSRLVINGATLGTVPTLTGTEATDITALEGYLPTRIQANWDIRSPITINRILMDANADIGLGIYADTELRWTGFYGGTTGIQANAGLLTSVSNTYVVHNSSYGFRVHSKLEFTGSTNVSLYNTTADYFATNGGLVFTGTKSGATFSPTRGSGFSTTGGSCH